MNIKSTLAILAVAGFFAVLTALFLVPIPKDNSQLVNTVVVALISVVSVVIGYYFGSSEGSAKKNEILDRVANPPLAVEALPTPGTEAGFIALHLLPVFLVLGLALALVGCATTPPTATDAADALANAQNAVSIADVLVHTAGPVAVAGVCAARPADCAAASQGLATAQATLEEARALLDTAQAANQAPPAARLSVLLAGITTNLGPVNDLIARYGGKPLDLTPYRNALAKLPAPASVATP